MVLVLKYIHEKQKALENPLGLKADRQSAIHYEYYPIFTIKSGLIFSHKYFVKFIAVFCFPIPDISNDILFFRNWKFVSSGEIIGIFNTR